MRARERRHAAFERVHPRLRPVEVDENPVRRRFADGQIIVIRAAQGVTELAVTGVERGTGLRLRGGESLTVMAAKGMDPPQWLVIR